MKMENLSGLLKMKVVRGINLAVRDCGTSDPYVIVRFDKHKLKTHVVKKNVNPEWNEDLTLLIVDPTQPIKLQVYDKDTFSLDDAMGQAEIDIRPFVEAVKTVKLRSDDLANNTIMGKIIPDRSNFYAEESRIYFCDGSIVQDAILRLRNVETGELVIQLRWFDVPIARSL